MLLEKIFWIFFKSDFETGKNVKNSNVRNEKINHFSNRSYQDFSHGSSLSP